MLIVDDEEDLIKKWEASGLLDNLDDKSDKIDLTKLMDGKASQLIKEQKINEIPDIKEYEFWFKEKFGCLPFEKHHGVGPTNIEEALSLRRDIPNDLSYSVITFEEYKKSKQK